jgi:hypothetical protein
MKNSMSRARSAASSKAKSSASNQIRKSITNTRSAVKQAGIAPTPPKGGGGGKQ